MKRILIACLLTALLFTTAAQAYEADIHFSTTYVLARAVGWPGADALTIASANQAVDENRHTVAALELHASSGPTLARHVASSLHQAEKNLRFHCFSSARGKGGRISADVRDIISGHLARVGSRSGGRRDAGSLIALGTALHCQQDAHAHVEFGGSCGPHPGSCYGHTHETLLDQVVFRLLGKHHFNPDHPGVSGHSLLEALQGTVRELAARRPRGSQRPTAANELSALADALRASGLELPDDVRRECNRYIAGKWLFETLHSRGTTHSGSDTLETLSPKVAATCRNAALASATIVRVPDPRFPRLGADASPTLVRADGTYQLMRDGDFDVSTLNIHVEEISADDETHRVKVQLSHWRQLLALPLAGQVRLASSHWAPRQE